jgi:hypothetical protein
MKRQLRPVLAAVALMCAPLAWSQSGYSTYPTSNGPQQQAGSASSSSSSPGGYSAADDSQQSNSGDSTESSSSSSQGTYQAPSPVIYSTYNMSGQQQQQGQAGSQDSSTQDQQQDSSTQSGGGSGTIPGASNDDTSGLGGPQATFTNPEKLPALNLFSDAVAHTGYSFNASGGIVGQYLGGYSGQAGYWQTLFIGSGGLSIVQVRPHLLWTAGYAAGVNQTAGIPGQYSSFSTLNQSANGRIMWQIAKRWQFRLKDSYFYSDDPFQPFFQYLGQPEPNYPDPVYYFPQTVVEQNQGTGDLSYMIGAHDTLNFYGAESFQHYLRGYQTASDLPNLGSLWNSTTYSGGVFFQHQFNRRWLGGEGYVFTAMDYGHGQSRAGVQMFQTFVTFKPNQTFSFSGWVGPELTGTKDLVPLICLPSGCLIQQIHNSYVNVAEGVTITYLAPHHNSFAIQGSNSITNGGGLFGTVKYYQATLTWSRPISRAWTMAMGFLYGHSDSLTNTQGDQFLHSAQGTISFSRKFNTAWSLSTYYAFIHQTQNYYGQFGLPQTVDTSGLGLTVQYTWNHSLGR